MPWHAAAAHAGFTTGKPWLPISAEHPALAVDRQQQQSDSQLALTRRLLSVRSAHQALRVGTLRFLDTPEPLLAFERSAGPEQLLCLFNLSAARCNWPSSVAGAWRILEQVGGADLKALPPYSALIAARGG
jgi:alpha-glucosidase